MRDKPLSLSTISFAVSFIDYNLALAIPPKLIYTGYQYKRTGLIIILEKFPTTFWVDIWSDSLQKFKQLVAFLIDLNLIGS